MSNAVALVERALGKTEIATVKPALNAVENSAPRVVKDLNAVPVKAEFAKGFNSAYGRPVLDAAAPETWRARMTELASNKKKFAAAAAAGLLATGGAVAVLEYAYDLAASGDEQTAAVVKKIAETVRDRISASTGDGKESTVMGEDKRSLDEHAAIEDVQFELIDGAIQAVGSLDMFRRLRVAMFGVEDWYLDRYQRDFPKGRVR